MKPSTFIRSRERVDAAITAIAAGRPVVLIDDHRGGEGSLVFAGSKATASLVGFVVRHTFGFLRAALTAETCVRLDLPPMRGGTEICRVTVDRRGHGTGISGSDRAATLAALASEDSDVRDFTRPGHVVPVCAAADGVLSRPNPAEAGIDLARLAGLPPAGAWCELVSIDHPGEIARGAEAVRFAAAHDLAVVSISDLVTYRRRTASRIRRARQTELVTERGAFRVISYEPRHVALLMGRPEGGVDIPLHLRRTCLVCGALGLRTCECGRAMSEAMRLMAAEGCGIIVQINQPGPAEVCTGADGIGNRSTVEIAAIILADLDVRSVRTVPHDPALSDALRRVGQPASRRPVHLAAL